MDAKEPLSAEAQARIDALVNRMSVAASLDAEIQAELRGHIEDKVRGYLTGAVKLTETDALLLAEKRFGEARVVKGMLQGVHGAAHAGSLGRRLAAAFVATMVASMAGAAIDIAWKASFGEFNSVTAHMAYSPAFVHIALAAQIAVVEVGALWILLVMWRRNEASIVQGWFDRWSKLTLGTIAAAMLMGACLLAYSRSLMFFALQHRDAATGFMIMTPTPNIEVVETVWGIICASYAAKAALWIWWSDRNVRAWRSTAMILGCWLLTTQVLEFIFKVAGLHAQVSWWPRGIMDLARLVRPTTIVDLQIEALMGALAVVICVSTGRRRVETAG